MKHSEQQKIAGKLSAYVISSIAVVMLAACSLKYAYKSREMPVGAAISLTLIAGWGLGVQTPPGWIGSLLIKGHDREDD